MQNQKQQQNRSHDRVKSCIGSGPPEIRPNSCRNQQILAKVALVMNAECQTDAGPWSYTSISVDTCLPQRCMVGNSNGQLRCSDEPNRGPIVRPDSLSSTQSVISRSVPDVVRTMPPISYSIPDVVRTMPSISYSIPTSCLLLRPCPRLAIQSWCCAHDLAINQ